MSGIMHVLITTLHVLACVALMVAILLQSGRGGGLAGAFGAGSSQTLFGGRGAATFLSRAATTLAVVFFLTSLTLGLASSRRGVGPGRSLIQEEARKRAGQRGAEQTAPPMGGGVVPGQGMTAPAPGAPSPAGPAQTSAPPGAAPAPTTQPKAPAKQPSKTSSSSGSTTQQAPSTTTPSGTTEPSGTTQQAPPADQQQQQNEAPSGSTTP